VLLAAVPVAAVDQLTKALVMRTMRRGLVVEVVRGLFDLVYFRNPGAAFSLFGSGGTTGTVLLALVSIVSLAVIGYLIKVSRSPLSCFSLSLIAGGAVGNLIDRVRFGAVVDFLSFHAGPYYWPAFNVADSAITCGAALAVYSYYFRDRRG